MMHDDSKVVRIPARIWNAAEQIAQQEYIRPAEAIRMLAERGLVQHLIEQGKRDD
jgi:hypothetical protein